MNGISRRRLLSGAGGLLPAAAPAKKMGRDLSAAMRGGNARDPESAFLMHIGNRKDKGEDGDAPLFRGVHTGSCTYAVANDGPWCPYDNREDPYQMRNLIDDPARASLRRELDGRVLGWLKKAEDPFPYERACRLRGGKQ